MPDAVTSRIGHLFCMPSPEGGKVAEAPTEAG